MSDPDTLVSVLPANASAEAATRPSRAALAVFDGGRPAAPRTLLDLLDNTTALFGDSPAVDDGEQVLSYRRLADEVARRAARLRGLGVGIGDRIGIRAPSGTAELYVAILAVLRVGAAYVPVDADDPADRAELVFGEAGVCFVLSGDGRAEPTGIRPGGRVGRPGPEDDAWLIFTSGSTGTPKGVAVTHRSAAAFVDAEARLFLADTAEGPLGPGDRVLAGLSVAFDASCEEMWLAWRHGACLVPAPRRLVRAGADLGPWLVARRISVVSTVPTLASLWPVECLAGVRLLIFGGEACPAETAARFDDPNREVWNTYGPTETTVVACAARLRCGEPVRIGMPLDGWQLAVVDERDQPVRWGAVGELVIAGVGVARYLDRHRDAAKFRPLPALGWARAYRTGDLVRADRAGLVFAGRADDQVKIAGRRVELGEIEAALRALPGVAAAAAAVRRTPGGVDVLVGYVVAGAGHDGGFPARSDAGSGGAFGVGFEAGCGAEFDAGSGAEFDAGFDVVEAGRRLGRVLPAALVPRLAVVAELPMSTAGKVDRAALPWPLVSATVTHESHKSHESVESDGTDESGDELTGWLRRAWVDLLGADCTVDSDFFALGGTSVAAARLVAVVRQRFPGVSVSDVYNYPTLGALRALVERQRPVAEPAGEAERVVAPTPRWTGWAQGVVQLVLLTVAGLRWLVGVGLAGNVLHALGMPPWVPTMSWWLVAPGWLLLASPPGRMAVAGLGARGLCAGLRPGSYRRGGVRHLRLWAAERLVAVFGVGDLVGTPLITGYARLLGARVGARVDLHALPPVTGLARFGAGCAVEPEADLSGWWLDGDRLRVGAIEIGAGARIGGRSTLLPGATVGEHAELLPGSCLGGAVPAGARWSGSPAGPDAEQPEATLVPSTGGTRRWRVCCAVSPLLRWLLPATAAVPVALLGYLVAGSTTTLWGAVGRLLPFLPVLTVLGFGCYAGLLALVIRRLGRFLRPGRFPLASRAGWAAWLTHQLGDQARRTLFPCYASLFTPVWLRLLGARVGRRVEASTALTLPALVEVADGAFLADDTLLAPYELRAGWVRLGRARVGARSFVGNSGIVGPDRTVGADSLIAVLSDAPARVPDGSSWLGRAPMRLPRAVEPHDPARTFAPPRRLVLARAAVELCRVAPLVGAFALGTVVAAVLAELAAVGGVGLAAALGGVVLGGAGVLAAAVSVLAKWALVGRMRVARHPLWSSFVWRNELYDVFVEELAVPWFVPLATGTPLLNWWLRGLGARIGRGVWCETHWLPEPDLVRIGAGASVNPGCVVQTHLFHDRIMRCGEVRLGAGATLGPHSIALPDTEIGAATTIGAGSLVMGGERVPARSRWQGNPIIAE